MTDLHSKLWAITCYFNPMRYRRRLANFRIFRECLQVPLVVVELTFGSEFELQAQDAEILIQLRCGAILWQKERLLNLALKALPNGCNKVAWLDCDIMFGGRLGRGREFITRSIFDHPVIPAVA